MADVPDEIVLRRDRDLVGRRGDIWVRRTFVAVFAAISVLALANVFGQHPSTTTKATAAATFRLYAPSRVRSGLLFSARFHITTTQGLRNARLVFDPGWFESMSVNTIEPSPVSETSDHGRVSFALGRIPPGGSHLLFMQFQEPDQRRPSGSLRMAVRRPHRDRTDQALDHDLSVVPDPWTSRSEPSSSLRFSSS